MTPFMLSVQALLAGESPASPVLTASQPVLRPVATDAQMMVRSLAEQLVSEANAVLREHGDVIGLDDEVGPGGLIFTLRYRGRAARVQTVIDGRYALASLAVVGEHEAVPRQLSSADELRALILNLIHPRQTSSSIR